MRRGTLALVVAGFAATGLLAIDTVFFPTLGYRVPQPDFYVYDLASRIGWAHGWGAMYDPSVFRPAVEDALGRFLPYLNPPLLAWIITPLTWLPYPLAVAGWTAILVGSLAVVWLVATTGSAWSRAVHLVAAIALLPVFVGMAMGQVSLLVAGVLAGSWWLSTRGRPWLAGVGLALAIALKPQIAFLVPLAFLSAGYWRIAVGSALTSLVVGAVMLQATGIGVLPSVNRSLQLTHGVLGPVQVSVVRQLPPLAAGLGLLMVVVLAVGGARWARTRGPTLPMAIGLVASMLVTPYLNFYDLSALVLGLWLVHSSSPPRWQQGMLVVVYAGLYVAPIWPLVTLACEGSWLASLAVLGYLTRPQAGKGLAAVASGITAAAA